MCYYDPLVAVLLTDPDLRLFTKLVDGSASSDVELDENIEGTPSSSSVFAPAADGAESVWEQWKI